MKLRYWLVIIAVFFLMIVVAPMVSSAPPFESTANSGVGFQIFANNFETIKINTDFNSHIHLVNVTNGRELENTAANCTIHVYDYMGNHIVKANYTQDAGSLYDWEAPILAGNFSTAGTYAFRVFCVNDEVGGAVSGTAEVTNSGKALTEGSGTIYFFVLITMLLTIILLTILQKSLPERDPQTEDGKIIKISWLKHLRPIIFAMILTMITVTFFVISNISFAYLPDMLIAKIFFTLFTIMVVLSPIIIILRFLYLLQELIQDHELGKLLNRGVEFDGKETF